MSESLSLVLFSGTDDKLHAAATIAAGAAAMGRPVNVLLMYWALDAFRTDRIETKHGLSYEAGAGRASRSSARGHPLAGDVPRRRRRSAR